MTFSVDYSIIETALFFLVKGCCLLMVSALLVYPWIYDFAAYDLWLKPLGLLYIASILRNLGVKVSFIDCLDRHHESLSPSSGNSVSLQKYGCGRYYYEEVFSTAGNVSSQRIQKYIEAQSKS